MHTPTIHGHMNVTSHMNDSLQLNDTLNLNETQIQNDNQNDTQILYTTQTQIHQIPVQHQTHYTQYHIKLMNPIYLNYHLEPHQYMDT